MDSTFAQRSGNNSGTIAAIPLSPAIGAEIVGIDLSQPLDDARSEWVRKAWHRHCILLFRNQQIEEADQLRFAAGFGEVGRLVTKHDNTDMKSGIMLISNIRKDGKPIGVLPDGEMFFHSDQCYAETPTKATMLYAMELPRVGGNTLFANMYLAYETLPDDVKQRLAGLKAVNVYDYDAAATVRGSVVREGVPHYAHPIVRTHPDTGRKALYVNRLMTDHIVGLPRDESDKLLEFLFDHQEQRRFIYEHVWRLGDLMLWDNRCSLHARTDFSPDERRLLRRVVVRGDKPF